MPRRLSLLIALLLLAACEEETPTEPETFTRWRSVSAGTYFSCAVTIDGEPACWGFYSAPEGVGGPFRVSAVPARVGNPPEFVDRVSVGGGVACGLDSAYEPYCWGTEVSGELGNGGQATDSSRTPRSLIGGMRFSVMSIGYDHACGLTLHTRQAFCWGSNLGGELGIGTAGPFQYKTSPTPVVGGLTFQTISAGTTHTCALTDDGTAYCWGGGYGAVGVVDPDSTHCGNGATCHYAGPQRVSTTVRFTAISAGNGFTCGIAWNGEGWCWGALFEPEGQKGVLGNGSVAGSPVPVRVAGGRAFDQIETGTRAVCGLSGGEAYCWGGNSLGELGIGGADGEAHPVPERVAGDIRFRRLSLGDVSCGISDRDRLYCWGTTYAGLLGNGETGPGVRARPTRVLDPLEE